MAFTIKITADSFHELGKDLALAAASFGATPETPVAHSSVVANKKEKAPVKKAPAEPAEPAKKAPAEPAKKAPAEPAKKAPAEEPESALTYASDVMPAVIGLMNSKGRPVVLSLLEDFGVKNAQDVDEARWPELLESIKEALEA